MQGTRIGRMLALVGVLAFFLALVPSHSEAGTIPTPTGTGAICVVSGKVQPTACALGGGSPDVSTATGILPLANGGAGASLAGCNANEIPTIDNAGTALACKDHVSFGADAVVAATGKIRLPEAALDVISGLSGVTDYPFVQWAPAGSTTTFGNAALYNQQNGFDFRVATSSGGTSIYIGDRFTMIDNRTGLTSDMHQIAQHLAADFTTTLATATALNIGFTAAVGEAWEIEFWCTALNPSGGIKWSIVAPSGSTVDGWLESVTTTVTTLSRQRFTAINTLNATATNTGASVAAPTSIRARINTAGAGAPGTISIGVASVTAGQTSTVRAGSAWTARRSTAL